MVRGVEKFNAHDADFGDSELLICLGLFIRDQGYNGWDIDNFDTLMQGLVIWSWLSCSLLWGCPFKTRAAMGGTSSCGPAWGVTQQW